MFTSKSIKHICASTVLLAGLKICNVINLPWWMVLAPIWMPVVALVAVCVAMALDPTWKEGEK